MITTTLCSDRNVMIYYKWQLPGECGSAGEGWGVGGGEILVECGVPRGDP